MKIRYYLTLLVLVLAASCAGDASAGIQGIDQAALHALPPESAATLSPDIASALQTFTLEDKILSAGDSYQFGDSVAISGDTVVVGADSSSSGGASRGQAYVFSRNQGGTNNWGLVKTLSASDKADYDYFGRKVAVSGDIIVVGAPQANSGGSDRGQAYVFSRNQGGTNNWGQVKILSASDKADNNMFGWSVAVSGDTAVIGAIHANSGGLVRGQAYVYSQNQSGTNNWGQVKILSASDKADHDYFGWSAAISGDTVVIGARNAASGGTNRGQAYVFSRNQGGTNNWGQVKILMASDKADNDYFGWSAAINGDIVIIGAYSADSGGIDRGQAYIFSRNQGGTNAWGQVKILSASDKANGDYFGYSVAVSGDTGVVGAYNAASGGTYRGQAYVFSRNQSGTNNWGQEKILSTSDMSDYSYFGNSVAVSNDTVVVGAYYRGHAYIYLQPVTPVANFTATPTSGTAPLTVQFTDTSTGLPTSWNWSFGDGNFSLTQNPSYTYTKPGTYSVVLQVYNTVGYNSTQKTDYINVSDLSVSPTMIGVFRPSTHLFYLDYNGNGMWNGAVTDRQYNFGISGDIPVTGDWNNDSEYEIGVFRPSTHLFYLDYNENGVWNGSSVDKQYNFGITGDIPVTGDWNSDGKTDIGVFRPSTHLFYLDYNGNGVWNGAGTDRSHNFGIIGDIPVSGDWNSDRRTEIGVFRPSTHQFYLDYNGNGVWNGAGVDRQYNFGISGDIPVAGDWNADGKTDIGVIRPSTHLFYLDYNGNGVWNGAGVDRQYNFGISNDTPISGKW